MSPPADPLVQFRNVDHVLVLSVAADRLASLEEVARFEREIRELAAARTEPHWIIDFRHVTFFITPAAKTLLAVRRRLASRGGQLVLTGITRDVHYILGLLGLTQVFTVRDTLDAGLAEISGDNGRPPPGAHPG